MPKKKDISAKTAKKAKAPLKSELEAENKALRKEIEAMKQDGGDVLRNKEINLRADDFIDVISLYSSTLSLSTEGHGKGKVYTFTKFGERKPIIYSDVMSIIENQMSFLENGFFYIANKDVVRRHGLEEAYSKILTKETMEEIISCNKSSVELYETANENQRKVINRILIFKLVAGENLDLNVVSSISRIGNKDLVSMAEEVKENRANN